MFCYKSQQVFPLIWQDSPIKIHPEFMQLSGYMLCIWHRYVIHYFHLLNLLLVCNGFMNATRVMK